MLQRWLLLHVTGEVTDARRLQSAYRKWRENFPLAALPTHRTSEGKLMLTEIAKIATNRTRVKFQTKERFSSFHVVDRWLAQHCWILSHVFTLSALTPKATLNLMRQNQLYFRIHRAQFQGLVPCTGLAVARFRLKRLRISQLQFISLDHDGIRSNWDEKHIDSWGNGKTGKRTIWKLIPWTVKTSEYIILHASVCKSIDKKNLHLGKVLH